MTVSAVQSRPDGVCKRWAWAALLAALVLAAVIRIGSALYSLWFDELASVFFASQPLAHLWSGWMVRETNPPLFYSLLHGWIALVGIGEVRLRLLPILTSLLVIATMFFGVRSSFDDRAAAVAALLLALSPQQLYFSHQIRAYMALYLAIALSFFGLVRLPGAVRRGRGEALTGWALYVGGAVAGIYLHTTAVIWPAAASLALALVDRRFRPFGGGQWRALLLANSLILLAASWWLGITLMQLRAPAGNLGWMEVMTVRKTALIFFANALLSRQIAPWQAIAPLIVALLTALGTWRSRDWVEARFAVACFFLASGMFVLLEVRQPVMLDRTLFWLSIFPLLMTAVGTASLRGRAFPIGVALLLIPQALNLALLIPQLVREDWRPVVFLPASDARAVLLVDGEAMNVAAEMACRVELAGRPCPFPVVTLIGAKPQVDSWGRGYAAPAPATGGRLTLAADVHAYLFERPFHEIRPQVQGAGLMRRVWLPPLTKPLLSGPLAGPFISEIARQCRVEEGVVWLSACAGNSTAKHHGPAGTGTPPI